MSQSMVSANGFSQSPWQPGLFGKIRPIIKCIVRVPIIYKPKIASVDVEERVMSLSWCLQNGISQPPQQSGIFGNIRPAIRYIMRVLIIYIKDIHNYYLRKENIKLVETNLIFHITSSNKYNFCYTTKGLSSFISQTRFCSRKMSQGYALIKVTLTSYDIMCRRVILTSQYN